MIQYYIIVTIVPWRHGLYRYLEMCVHSAQTFRQ
jgi:hypothetical protein